MMSIDEYYYHRIPNNGDLQKYLNSLIMGEIPINYTIFFKKDKLIEKNGMIDIFCLGINIFFNNDWFIEGSRLATKEFHYYDVNYTNINIENFKFCLFGIIYYFNSRKSKFCETCESKNVLHFINHINKLRYCDKNKLECMKDAKQKYKECTNETFKKYASQIFMEYLDFYYYEYLKKIFAPGGKGYIKTKNHFESIAKQTM
jgi:hypothetical protein